MLVSRLYVVIELYVIYLLIYEFIAILFFSVFCFSFIGMGIIRLVCLEIRILDLFFRYRYIIFVVFLLK